VGVVREMAGHASLTTTNRYVRLARNELAGAASTLDSYISSYMKGGSETGDEA